jgi:SepF-like predicted cell division protein (DUF552 family)
MSEIGSLIIKLQAQTAEFRDDMGKVKQDLNDLKGGSQEAGAAMDHSFGEARGGLMLTEHLIGVSLPRHLNSLIAQIPGVGAAFATMLPIVGVLLFIEILGKVIDKHKELKEEADKLRDAQNNLMGTIGTVFSSLNDKLLQAGIKADELRGNHLAKLKKELELIDHQSMKELAQSFDELAKAAEGAFAQLKAHWYQFGSGSEGAKHSLEAFQSQYELLLKTGKNDEANKMLDEKIKREEKILALQKQARDSQMITGIGQITQAGNYQKYEEAIVQLKQLGVGFTQKEVESEQDLVDILHAQADAHAVIAKTSNIEKSNLTTKDVLKSLSDEATLQKIITAGVDAHAAALRKLAQTQAEATLGGDKGNKQESIDDRLGKELAAISTEHDAAIAAADQIMQSKKTLYDADLKAAGQNAAKKKELDAQYANEVRAHDDTIVQADAEAQKKSVAATAAAANEKKRIDIQAAQSAADETLRIAIEDAKNTEKIAMEKAKDLQALHKRTTDQTLQSEIAAVNAETAAEVKGYNDRIKALDKFDAEYTKKVQAFESKIKEIEKKSDTEITQLKEAALKKEQMDVTNAYHHMEEGIASDVAKSIVMNQNLVQSFRHTGEQMVEGMIKNLIMMELTHDKEKLINAEGAFEKSFNWASSWGGPIAGGIAGAAAFAAVMSFEVGGKIPGSGPVPIQGHGGETVVTKALTDRVEAAEGRGNTSHTSMQVHATFAPTIHAIDADGVEGMLQKHQKVFQREITNTLRKYNR